MRSLYDNASVFIDHDLEAGPSRGVRELAGIVINPRLVDGLPRGDILLRENAAGGELKSIHGLSKAAKKAGASLKHVGFSHVAAYTFESKDRKRVQRVEAVYSCDLVVRPATTQTLFESQNKVSEELKGLTDELNKIRGERDQLQADLKTAKASLESLQGEHTKLQGEAKANSQALDALKAEKAIAERKGLILEGLKAAGLDIADKDVCSEAFLEILTSEANAEKRASLIKDRAGLLAKAKPAPTSTERKEESKTFDPSKALETISFS